MQSGFIRFAWVALCVGLAQSPSLAQSSPGNPARLPAFKISARAPAGDSPVTWYVTTEALASFTAQPAPGLDDGGFKPLRRRRVIFHFSHLDGWAVSIACNAALRPEAAIRYRARWSAGDKGKATSTVQTDVRGLYSIEVPLSDGTLPETTVTIRGVNVGRPSWQLGSCEVTPHRP